MINFLVLLFVAFIIALEAVAQYFLKNLKGNVSILSYNFILACGIYVVICVLLLKSYRFDKVTNVYMLWNGGGIIFFTVFSMVLFDQKIEAHEYVAMALIAVAMFLLYYYGDYSENNRVEKPQILKIFSKV